MPKPIPTQRSVALGVLRRVRGWTGRDLAQAAGISETMVSYYESGHRCPSHKVLLTLAASMGFGEEEVTCILFGLAGVAEPSDRSVSRGLTVEATRAVRREAVRTGLAAAREAEERLVDEALARRAEEERRAAEGRFRQLVRLGPAQRDGCLERCTDGPDWALVERICAESERVASLDPQEALLWAHLAVRAGGLHPGSFALRSRLQGYAWAFLGNARRVGSDLPGAELAFQTAWKLWRKGRACPQLPPLGEWYLFDLEASLRRDQRKPAGALALHKKALAVADGKFHGRILLKKAATLLEMGDPQSAIGAITTASGLVDPKAEPRLGFAIRFNLAASLNAVGRTDEALRVLPELRLLATELRSEVDLIRTLWLQARIEQSLGRLDEALPHFEQVRREFVRQRLPYDAALATLETAVLAIERQDYEQVERLARESVWIFRSQQVARETIAALQLFCEAARRKELTLAVARRALREMLSSNPASLAGT